MAIAITIAMAIAIGLQFPRRLLCLEVLQKDQHRILHEHELLQKDQPASQPVPEMEFSFNGRLRVIFSVTRRSRSDESESLTE